MNLKSNINIALISLLFLASCASIKQSKTREINTTETQVVPKTLVGEVEIDVNKPILGEAVVTNGDVNEAKALAKWNALLSSGAHMIIDPVFKIDQTAATVRVQVKGYYGEYASVKTATKQDLLDFITIRLLTGNGILDVPYDQFRFYYYAIAEQQQIDPELLLTEEELIEFYLDELFGEDEIIDIPSNTITPTTNSSNYGSIEAMLNSDFNLNEVRSKEEMKLRANSFKQWTYKERKEYFKRYGVRRQALSKTEKKQLRKKSNKEMNPAVAGLIAVEIIALIAIPIIIINY